MVEDLRSAEEWLASEYFEGVTILDPDGWDRKNFDKSWPERINRDEMERRMCMSTVQIMPDSPMHPLNFVTA